MAEGLHASLVLSAIFAGCIGVLFLRKLLPPVFLSLIVFIKIAIPFVYFAWFFDGTWTFKDDLDYFKQGQILINSGYNPVSFFYDGGINVLISHTGGMHIFYGWWNHLAQYLFGVYYSSPVFMNVVFTFVAGFFLFKISELCGFSRTYSQAFLCYFLLHLDVLVWSSFVNLKDIFVMTLTIITFYLIIKLLQNLTIKRLFAVSICFIVFFFVRFYIPLLIIATLFTHYIISTDRKGIRKFTMLLFILIGGIIVIKFIGIISILKRLGIINLSAISVLGGMPRMFLTPRPWAIEPSYSFLLMPSTINWLLIPFACIGAVSLWLKSRMVRILLIYLLFALVLYGAVERLQEPRHRVQATFIIVWMQYHFLWILVKGAVSNHQFVIRKLRTLSNNTLLKLS